MRYAHINPHGEVVLGEGDGSVIVEAGLDNSMSVDGVTVWFDEGSSGAYNWQAQRLLRDRLMPEDRICGDVIVTGVGGDDTPDSMVADMVRRYVEHAQ